MTDDKERRNLKDEKVRRVGKTCRGNESRWRYDLKPACFV